MSINRHLYHKSMSSSGLNFEKYLIPLDEIKRATENFHPERHIGDGGFGIIYKGQLSLLWQNRTAAFKRLDVHGHQGKIEFRNELEIISRCHHENIITFIGYCDENSEMIIVYEYASNGSLDHHLQDSNKKNCMTWRQRLEICLGAAKGLAYLHSGDNTIIHRDVKGGSILLDGNMVPKISDFGLSILVDPNHPEALEGVAGTIFYVDPVYEQSGTANTESDVYSFGVVLFEMLSGMLVYTRESNGDDQPQSLLNLVRRNYDDGLYNLIDHNIRDQINMRSFNVFKKIAHQCISYNLKYRPKMDMIINKIQEALDVQNHRASSTVVARSGLQFENLESFLIPLEEIRLSTRDFSSETRITDSDFGTVYRGQLSKQWQNRTAAFKRWDQTGYRGEHEFVSELKMISSFNHENIIRFIGYCDQRNEKIIVSEIASNGSLEYHLEDPKKSSCLTWAQRMQICLGAARGLDYLHSGLGENKAVIHRDVKSANILLDDNLDTKICGFYFSLLVDRKQPRVYDMAAGTAFYLDPIYKESGMVNTGTDVYSFGIVLFEMLSGLIAYRRRSIDDGRPQTLLSLVKRYYDDGLDKLIDPNIRDQMNIHSLYTFKKIAYRCISLNLNDRPTMKTIIRRIEEALNFQNNGINSSITTRSRESSLIPLEEIKLASGTFIGSGGFGNVFKGKLSQRWQSCTVAIKYRDKKSHQGKKEFDTEINLLSRFYHPNIIPFIGYCDEQDQMILVYQYAINGSLDDYLRNPNKMRSLTWAQRLKICLGAAKGLDYLHSGLGKHHRVIHRDLKSANMLLDEKLEAKICDFGLSTEGPENQEGSQIFTKVAGTNYYMDPIYYGSGILRKESDIYSLGVVFFEMLSGRLAYNPTTFVDNDPQYLINLVRRYYEYGPEKLIDPDIKDHIDSRSFQTFKEIAYQSISLISKERPTMDTIIDKIEDAIDFQASDFI